MPGNCKRSFQYCPFRVSLAMASIVFCTRLWCSCGSGSVAWAADDAGKLGRAAATERTSKEIPIKIAAAIKADPADVDFFEKKVRPILSARCQGCHGPEKQKGGLRLDARATVLAGGTTGPAVVPGNPKESLLVDAINYGETYQMPPKSKLPPGEIATLTEWVERGAPWGITAGTSTEIAGTAKIPGALSKAEFQARARYWSFQPLRKVSPPAVQPPHSGWVRNPIDRFILAALEQKNLTPAPEAGRRTLIRRLSFDLTGLPPKPHDVEAFVNDRAPDAYEKLVDSLLASPHYGERWARHWLDLVRYAETAGHEYDYEIPHAFRYRDYVIRAFNLDVPYDQLVVEHISGDALERPRRHLVEGFNESAIGAGFHALGEGVHSPVDLREEQMRRVDNQLDVLSKTFLGLTLACARCHDHKFDPIMAQDYYAMAGYLVSSRHQQAFLDPPERVGYFVKRLRDVQEKVIAILREARDRLPEPARQQAAALAASTPRASALAALPAPADAGEQVLANFDRDDFDGWFVTGAAFGGHPSRAGDIRFNRKGSAAHLVSIAPGLAHSGMVSDRLQGVLRSRSFTIESRYIHFLTCGEGGRISVVIDGFEKIRSPIYGDLTTTINTGGELRWITMDVQMWARHSAYFEIADGAVVDFGGTTAQVDDGHGWIAVGEIRTSDRPAPSAPAGQNQRSIEQTNLDLPAAIAALRAVRPELAQRLADAVAEADDLERQIPDPMLAPSQAEGTGMDEHVHIRGSYKNLGELAPRHFLTVLGGSDRSRHEVGSSRLDLAGRMVDPAVNPLVPRVLVNRLWQHHFGEGIVRSTDDFGAMGQKPSHPELLDWLAAKLVESGWSIKAMHRLMLCSSTFRMSSVPETAALQADPANILLHRMNVRRLEAEAIRDTLLAVTGRLEGVMYGPSVPVHLTSYMEGRGRPARSGTLDGDGRRSIYLSVRRNFLNPMFLAFDAPVPFSTMGRRNVSNVPAQALTLLNDPLVKSQSRLWAERQAAAPGRSVRQRLDGLYLAALGRGPSLQEARASLDFLAGRNMAETGTAGQDPEPTVEAWADLCHVLINMKEFIFVD
jgi:hypothetical protein